jgi:uncharacterized protein
VLQLSSETETKFADLKRYLSTLKSAAIAYSGGVDSTLLLYAAAQRSNLKLIAYTVKTELITEDEIKDAVSLITAAEIEHHIINTDILSHKEVMENPPERCYHCKKIILTRIITAASLNGITTILEGSHTGDLKDYRPGLRAIEELGVISPLKNSGFDKNNIYELSSYLKLPTSEKESYPCLATRIPYGTQLTVELLNRAEHAEKILASFGFRKIRARIHGDILRIEIEEEMIPEIAASAMRKKVFAELKKAGFRYITLDLQGYKTGSMNLNAGENQ